MTSIPVFVGLDYHQDSVQVCVLDEDGSQLVNRSVRNESETIRRLISRHGVPKRMGIEACCGAADLAEDLAVSHGLPIQLAHPGYVNRMKRSPDKTDLGDAQLLADLVRVNYLPRVWLAPRDTRELRRLVRFRSQLVQRQTDTKLRIRGLLRENRQKCLGAQAWTKKLVQMAGNRRSERLRSLDHQRASRRIGFSVRTYWCSECENQDASQGRSCCTDTLGANWRRHGDCRDDASRNWPLRSIQLWKAALTVLWRHASQRKQRRSPGRRGFNQSGQLRATCRPGRIGPSSHFANQRSLGRHGSSNADSRQTQERDRCSHRKPLGAVVVSRNAKANGRLGDLCSGSTKGARPYRFDRHIDLIHCEGRRDGEDGRGSGRPRNIANSSSKSRWVGALEKPLGSSRRSSVDGATFPQFRKPKMGYLGFARDARIEEWDD